MRDTNKRTRRGVGTWFLSTVMVLFGLTAASMASWVSTRGAITRMRASEQSEEMLRAGDGWMALARALVQRWVNEEGGPDVQPMAKPLYRALREEMRDPAFDEPSVRFLVSVADMTEALGAAPSWPGSDRFTLEGQALQVIVTRPESSGVDATRWFKGGEVRLEAILQDQEGAYPDLVIEATHTYTVAATSAPPPFDRYCFVVGRGGDLVGTQASADIRRYKQWMLDLRTREFAAQTAKLEAVKAQLASLPVNAAALDRALQALADGRTPPQATRVPGDDPNSFASRAIIGQPGRLSAAPLDLEKLYLVPRAEQARDRAEDREAALDAAEDRLDAAISAVGQATDLAAMEPALGAIEVEVGAWITAARASWQAADQGLGVYADLEDAGAETWNPDTFRDFWGRLRATFWRDKAHWVVRGETTAELSEKLAELAETVRPLNGVVYVDNPPGLDARLDLVGFDHGLEGRYLLAVRGDVLLDGFRPQASDDAAEGDRSRAMVIADGDLYVDGEVQAAVACNGRLVLRDAHIRGALYAPRVPDTWDSFGDGRVSALPDDEASHRFRATTGGHEFRASHLLVAISPSEEEKSVAVR